MYQRRCGAHTRIQRVPNQPIRWRGSFNRSQRSLEAGSRRSRNNTRKTRRIYKTIQTTTCAITRPVANASLAANRPTEMDDDEGSQKFFFCCYFLFFYYSKRKSAGRKTPRLYSRRRRRVVRRLLIGSFADRCTWINTTGEPAKCNCRRFCWHSSFLITQQLSSPLHTSCKTIFSG